MATIASFGKETKSLEGYIEVDPHNNILKAIGSADFGSWLKEHEGESLNLQIQPGGFRLAVHNNEMPGGFEYKDAATLQPPIKWIQSG